MNRITSKQNRPDSNKQKSARRTNRRLGHTLYRRSYRAPSLFTVRVA
jgi:hypothetical protein